MATVWFGCWQLDHSGWLALLFTGVIRGVISVGIARAVYLLPAANPDRHCRNAHRFWSISVSMFIALDILAAYCDLFGSMQRTGVMFLISGIFLIVFGVYLEKKRRALMKQIKSQTTGVKP